jgi:hypothetical protein
MMDANGGIFFVFGSSTTRTNLVNAGRNAGLRIYRKASPEYSKPQYARHLGMLWCAVL